MVDLQDLYSENTENRLIWSILNDVAALKTECEGKFNTLMTILNSMNDIGREDDNLIIDDYVEGVMMFNMQFLQPTETRVLSNESQLSSNNPSTLITGGQRQNLLSAQTQPVRNLDSASTQPVLTDSMNSATDQRSLNREPLRSTQPIISSTSTIQSLTRRNSIAATECESESSSVPKVVSAQSVFETIEPKIARISAEKLSQTAIDFCRTQEILMQSRPGCLADLFLPRFAGPTLMDQIANTFNALLALQNANDWVKIMTALRQIQLYRMVSHARASNPRLRSVAGVFQALRERDLALSKGLYVE